MQYIRRNSDSTDTRVFTEKNMTSSNASATVITVGDVAAFEAAVAAQIANQTIELLAGSYQLTESLTILLAASGGGLVGVGAVSILGAADADEAILIDPAVATSTFEYALENIHIQGGADKIGLHILNTNVNKKVNVYMTDVELEDNGSGKALTYVNSDGSNAIRIYWNGGSVDGIAATPSDTGDRLILRGVNVEENLVAASVNVVATYFFSNCQLPHEGMTGGHASNVISTAYCWTAATAYVPVLVDSNDFPGDFSATIVGA